MELEIKINEKEPGTRVVIHTPRMNREVEELVKRLEPDLPDKLVGFEQELATILEPEQIVRVYAENQKVMAEVETRIYQLKMRLYEVETILDVRKFARISHSEIVNLSHVKQMDLSFTGTICMRLSNGKTSFVSRRYMPKIKKVLGLGR